MHFDLLTSGYYIYYADAKSNMVNKNIFIMNFFLNRVNKNKLKVRMHFIF